MLSIGHFANIASQTLPYRMLVDHGTVSFPEFSIVLGPRLCSVHLFEWI